MSAAELRDMLRCDRPRCACKRGRSVHCPAHQDRSPSFVVDQVDERLLVHCHAGCDQRAVIAALQARQLWPEDRAPGKGVADRQRLSSPLEEARREILVEARRQLGRLPLEQYRRADEIRACHQLVARARRVATALGDCDEAWDLLERAAWIETATLAAEATS